MLCLAECDSSGEVDLERVERGGPVRGGVAAVAGPAAADVAHAEVEQLQQRVVVGEVPTVLRDLAQLVVDALDRVGGVEDVADLGREREERDHVFPVVTPELDDAAVTISVTGRERVE